jgi:glucan biosynthesis protein C
VRCCAAVSVGGSQRVASLDLLRVALVALVICHHVACAVANVGAWYYILPPPRGGIARLVLTAFASTNQAFFMSLLYFVSGYFTAPSQDRKTLPRFVRDRGLRLGIPLLFYFFFLNPHVVYLSAVFRGQAGQGYWAWMERYYLQALGPGPMWFVGALLIFTAAYLAWRRVRPGARGVRRTPLPGHGTILAFVLVTGATAFGVRLVVPVGVTVLSFQLAYFPLYVCMFFLGIHAYRSSWFDQLGPETVGPWFRAALVAIVAMPIALVLAGAGAEGGATAGGGTDPFIGGLHWEAALYAAWEPVVCVGVSGKLLMLFRDRFRRETPLLARASRSAYTVYIIHPFFVVTGTWLLATSPPDTLLKFALLCPAAVLSCFAAADLVRRAPLVRKVV